MREPQSPTWRQRLVDTLFIRRADQTILAMLIFAGLLGIGIWWWRSGGAEGRLVDYDHLPQHRAEYVVDINRATMVELTELPGVGQILAERIIEHRDSVGPFRSVDDLRKVHGIGGRTVEVMLPHVSFDVEPTEP